MKLIGRTIPTAAETSPSHDVRKVSNTSTMRSENVGADSSVDRIDFSSHIRILGRPLSTSENRNARVQALAAEYQRGHYWPDSNATSRDMVSGALVGY